MRRLLAVLMLLWAVPAWAQQSTVLSAERSIDWTGVGATIATRTTQCGSTIAAYTGTAATINTAIQNCTAGQYVHLGTGTFNLSSSDHLRWQEQRHPARRWPGEYDHQSDGTTPRRV